MNILLRNARRRALLNQYQLAKKCGMSQAYYSGIERGDIIAKRKYKVRIAAALDLPAVELFSEIIDDTAEY